jgi:hypothetical protein
MRQTRRAEERMMKTNGIVGACVVGVGLWLCGAAIAPRAARA